MIKIRNNGTFSFQRFCRMLCEKNFLIFNFPDITENTCSGLEIQALLLPSKQSTKMRLISLCCILIYGTLYASGCCTVENAKSNGWPNSRARMDLAI